MRGRNIHGWGPWSLTYSFSAVNIPGKILTPVVTSLIGTDVKLNWNAPSTSGGEGLSIIEYDIEVKD